MKDIAEIDIDELLIEGVLKEYVELEKQLKPMNKRMAELKEWCKQLGTHATMNYVCSVRTQERTGIVSLANAEELVGRPFLEKNGMIKTTTFEIVSVSKK